MKPPAFQFYADDFLSGTSEMSPEEVGIYIRLLCHQWTKGGLPTDEPRLARMAGIDANAMVLPSLSYVLAKFVASPDGLLKNDRMERVRAEQDANRAKRASAGAKGAESRWGNGKRNGNAMPEPLAKPSQNDSSPTPTPTPSNSIAPNGAKEIKIEKKERPRNPLFDAIAEQCGVLNEMNDVNAKAIGTALKNIRQSTPDVTPDEIKDRCNAYRAKWPSMSLTPMSLAKHWPSFNPAASEPVRFNLGTT